MISVLVALQIQLLLFCPYSLKKSTWGTLALFSCKIFTKYIFLK
jgi:dolichol kinase